MRLKASTQVCFGIYVERPDGEKTDHGLFQVIDSWEGLVKVRRVTDEKYLIIGDVRGTGFQQMFGEIFRDELDLKNTYVVNGTPSLIDELKQAMGQT